MAIMLSPAHHGASAHENDRGPSFKFFFKLCKLGISSRTMKRLMGGAAFAPALRLLPCPAPGMRPDGGIW